MRQIKYRCVTLVTTKCITTFYSIESVTAPYNKYINYQSPITNYQLPITNHQSPITNYQLPITNSNFDTKKINHKQQIKIKYMLIDNKKKLHNQLKLINISDK